MNDPKHQLMQAALVHVAFDGWSPETFAAAIVDAEIEPVVAKSLCPGGAADLAAAYHQWGDELMVQAYGEAETGHLKIREKVTLALRLRLEAVVDKEVVRRGATMFAMPQHAGTGAKLLWGTADKVWAVLGDSSRDVNWYTKRATLSAVYGATVLFWLGDDSPIHAATWDFLDRRIENVMQFEKAKAATASNPLLRSIFAGPKYLLSSIKAPEHQPGGLPGQQKTTVDELP